MLFFLNLSDYRRSSQNTYRKQAEICLPVLSLQGPFGECLRLWFSESCSPCTDFRTSKQIGQPAVCLGVTQQSECSGIHKVIHKKGFIRSSVLYQKVLEEDRFYRYRKKIHRGLFEVRFGLDLLP